MKEIIRTDLLLRALLIGLAAIASAAFPAAQAGYSTLPDLAYLAIIPAAILLVLAWALLRRSSAGRLAGLIRDGAAAGALATVALEVVRYSGFRMGFMPGNLPELMGVLRFDRFALGPTAASTLGGFTYHFWNGACFGIIFARGSICQFGGPFPTEPIWASVSSSVPWSRDWALAFAASTLDGTSLLRSSQPILHSVRRWPRRSGAIEIATPNVQ
jgi:hypothetical protein